MMEHRRVFSWMSSKHIHISLLQIYIYIYITFTFLKTLYKWGNPTFIEVTSTSEFQDISSLYRL